MFKFIKKLYNNRPWKEYTTRKLSFTYCLWLGTFAIIFGGVMIFLGKGDFDSATWLTQTLNFAKFIVGTGCTLVVAGTIENIAKYKRASNDLSSDEDTLDSESEAEG